MPNPPALSPDTVYHIFNRGNNRENLFKEERNYEYFLRLYLHHVAPFVETYAYCLLRNHFHLLVKILDPKFFTRISPSRHFAVFFNAYAKAINIAYDRSGSLFQNPFGRVAVTTDAQFLTTVRYIHRNPQNHGLTTDFQNWPYSSYQALLSEDPTFLAGETVISRFGSRTEMVRFHTEPIARSSQTAAHPVFPHITGQQSG